MKYLLLVGDGMGDLPIPELNDATPLRAARTPNMDRLAQTGNIGLAQTIPQGMEPGSDVANLSLLGYDPARYHTGRSPLEAAAMGVELAPDEIAFRCNLVMLRHEDGRVLMEDYAGGHPDDASAARFIQSLDEKLGRPGLKFHPGVSYRHLLVWKNGPLDAATVPPHDRSAQPVDDALGEDNGLAPISELTRKSWDVLKDHPENQKRIAEGKPPIDSIWLWGQGTRPALNPIPQRFGLSGLTVSAVDLIRGLGVLAGLPPVMVPGLTGLLDTNLTGKVEAILKGLADKDMAFLHVEAPDEAGHSGILADKLKAIELFDEKVVGPVMRGLAELGPHRVLLATDHFTPLSVRTHTIHPVPFVIWDSENPGPGAAGFNEAEVAAAWDADPVPAHNLMQSLVEK